MKSFYLHFYFQIYSYMPKVLQDLLKRLAPGLIREPVPVRVRSWDGNQDRERLSRR